MSRILVGTTSWTEKTLVFEREPAGSVNEVRRHAKEPHALFNDRGRDHAQRNALALQGLSSP